MLTEPRIPAALAPVIAGFRQLHDWHAKPLYHPAGVFKRDQPDGRVAKSFRPEIGAGTYLSITTGTTYYAVGPQDWYTIYNSRPLYQAGITGAGTTIAVIEETEVANQADVTSFRSQFGLPAYPATPNSTQGGVNWIYGPGNGCGAPPMPTIDRRRERRRCSTWSGRAPLRPMPSWILWRAIPRAAALVLTAPTWPPPMWPITCPQPWWLPV